MAVWWSGRAMGCDTAATTCRRVRNVTSHGQLPCKGCIALASPSQGRPRNHGSDLLRLHFPNPPPNTQTSPNSHRNTPWYVQLSVFLVHTSSSSGQPSNILYSYLHTNFVRHTIFYSLYLLLTIHSQNLENYLLTPSPQGDLCVAKLFPPRANNPPVKASASDPGHGSGHGGASSRVVRCEASRNLKWSITNTGVISPIYKLALPSPDSPDLPLFQISKPNPNAAFWSMFYFAYAGHNIPPKRIEFGKIQKNPPGPNGGGTRITISGKTPEEKAVWQTLGEGNEDCVEWVVLCAALNLLE
jgi:hypothetical protein